MANGDDVEALVRACEDRLDLDGVEPPDGYGHAALCVIDAVFSIGVNYGQVKQVVARYARHADIPDHGTRGVPADGERTVADLVADYDAMGWEALMDDVFRNRTWTSTSGTRKRKAEAVGDFARVLHRHGVDSVADVTADLPTAVKRDVVAIPGQRSGLSWFYFLMLAGADEYVKADRHIRAFVDSAVGRTTSAPEAARLVREAAHALRDRGRGGLTPVLLDHRMWLAQSGRA